jgi:drug/metabolite transporter (DMT)-like permease
MWSQTQSKGESFANAHMKEPLASKTYSGSYLVAVGAALWSVDSLFRSHLTDHYPAFVIVLITQFVSMFVVFPLCWRERGEISKLRRTDWLAFLFLSVFSNILAMVAFTYSFAHAVNYSTPILIQKLQPLISIASAVIVLKEELPKNYFLYAGAALVGSALVGFGQEFRVSLEPREWVSVLFAGLAAFLWGFGTTVGRFVSTRHSFVRVTVLRYGISELVLLLLLPLWWNQISPRRETILRDAPQFVAMALIPGLIALFIYYRGLQSARASVACWLELAYPISAVAVNWIFLDSALSFWQILGSAVLLISVTTMTYRQSVS